MPLGYYGQWAFVIKVRISEATVQAPEICIPASTNDTDTIKPKYQQWIFHISKSNQGMDLEIINVPPIWVITSFLHEIIYITEIKIKNQPARASLVAQWLRICLPMQGTRVWALVWEDPTCRGATRPVSHNYWACTSGACALQQERLR